MDPDHQSIALITGASSGIGWSTAKALAREGYRVALTARREDRLTSLNDEIGGSGGMALVIPADLTEEAERERLISTVAERWGRIDVLINNAGHGWIGWQASIPADIGHRMLALNVEAVVHLTTLVLPDMLARRSGHVVNVASTAGDIVLPTQVLYCATKTFVQSFSRGLQRELRGTGVWISVINPGPVRTEFRRVAAGIPVDQRPEIEAGIPAERVAEAIVRVIKRPRGSVYVPGALGVVASLAPALGPILDRFGRLIAERRLRSVAGTLRKPPTWVP